MATQLGGCSQCGRQAIADQPFGVAVGQNNMRDDLGVLASTEYVLGHARFVSIDHSQVAAVASSLAAAELRPPSWDAEQHYADGTARTANYVLVLDALNFCFWGEPRWRVEHRGTMLDGYWALTAALKRALAEGIPLLDARYLAQLTRTDLARVLRGHGEIPMLDRRLANLREVGSVLLDKYEGCFTKAIEAADHSAVHLVLRVAADFPSFDDVAHYRRHVVRFYKRAQILVADLYGAFGGRSWGWFDDLDRLTAFADYKVPQMLRHLGILSYAPALSERIAARETLTAGSPEEIEIRAATIWGVEYLRQTVAERGRPLRAFELDWYLWDLSQREGPQMLPYHRARTVFY